MALAALILAGCNAPEAAAPRSGHQEVTASDLPEWVLSPGREGYLCGVGEAGPQAVNPAYQHRAAMMQAKAAIAREIELYVRTELTTEKQCTDAGCKSEMTTHSKHLSRQLIEAAEVANEWTDPKTGTLYIRLIVKKEETRE